MNNSPTRPGATRPASPRDPAARALLAALVLSLATFTLACDAPSPAGWRGPSPADSTDLPGDGGAAQAVDVEVGSGGNAGGNTEGNDGAGLDGHALEAGDGDAPAGVQPPDDCLSGTSRPCVIDLGADHGVTSCFPGTQWCEDGAWGLCSTAAHGT